MKFLTLFIALLALSCVSNTDKTSDGNSADELQRQLDSLFNAEIPEDGPGAALLVTYDDEMIIGAGYGLRDLESKQPVTPSTNIRMASVSKQFTALCALSLVDKRLLSLSDTVSAYLPYPVFERITIEQLMNHTSGLADYEEYFSNHWDRGTIVENKHILNWLKTNPAPIFEPGSKWEYSNTAYLVLAMLVEKVSGQEFSAYAKEHVFDKAGMKHTTYYNLAAPEDGIALYDGIRKYMHYYNTQRRHQSINNDRPKEVYVSSENAA